MRAARRHRHSPGFHLWQTQKDLFSSVNNRETWPEFRWRDSARAVRARALSSVIASSVPPARRDGRKDHANKDDQGSDLNPDKPAKLSEDDFDAIAPRGRQSGGHRLYAMPRGSAAPFGPGPPVIKSHPNENPRPGRRGDSETV